MKHILSNSVFAVALLFICTQCLAQEAARAEGDWALPYGNLGLDCASSAIAGANTDLQNASGVKFFMGYYADLLTNPYGGDEQGTNYTYELAYGLNADLEKSLGWKGAGFTISGAYTAGANLSNKIGNFFTASQSYITAHGAIFYQLFLSQKVGLPWDDTLEICMGRMSMASHFVTLPVFDWLANGAMNSSPQAMFANSPYSSSPVATWAAYANYETVNDLAFAAGLYQLAPSMHTRDWNGTDFGIGGDDGYMMMFEAAWRPVFYKENNGGYAGVYKLGGYFFDGYDMTDYSSPAGGTATSNCGMYLEGQQQVWVDSSNKLRYVTLWAGAFASPDNGATQMSIMTFAGVQLQGFVPCRTFDGIYLSWLSGWFGSDYSNVYSPAQMGFAATSETVFEVTYVFQVNEHIFIQPDLQYIFNPYGNPDGNDALVIGGQLTVLF